MYIHVYIIKLKYICVYYLVVFVRVTIMVINRMVVGFTATYMYMYAISAYLH